MSTKAACDTAGCDRPARRRGWCSKHHRQWLYGLDCTALTGRCTCLACTRAAGDDESPLALRGGRWVLDPATRARTWQADPPPPPKKRSARR